MNISIHQPTYWPWLGLLNKVALSDIFIILDNVEASKGSFQYRNLFLCNNKAKYVTLPVNLHNRPLLSDLKFKDSNWKKKQLSLIADYYRRSDYFHDIFPEVIDVYEDYQSNSSCGLIINSMLKCFELFDINVIVKKASDLNLTKKKGMLVLEICQKLKVSTYISGQGAIAYMNKDLIEDFSKAGIQLKWQTFTHPTYYQGNKSPNFIEGLSSLDLLFHNGIENSRSILYKTIK